MTATKKTATTKKPTTKKTVTTKKPSPTTKSTKEILKAGAELTKDVTKKVAVESKEFIQKHDLVNKTKHAAEKTAVVSENIIKRSFRKIKNMFNKKPPINENEE